LIAALPDRADSMNDIFCRQVKPSRYSHLTGGATAKWPAGFKKFWTSSSVNGTVNATPAKHAIVCCVYDSINFKGGNVAFDCSNYCHLVLRLIGVRRLGVSGLALRHNPVVSFSFFNRNDCFRSCERFDFVLEVLNQSDLLDQFWICSARKNLDRTS
jgi:hypothetical protein